MQAESRTAAPTKSRGVGDKTDDLRTLLALHAIALGTMSHGLCVLDEESRLVLFNQRFLEIMQLAPDTVGVGTSFRAVLELAVARGQLTRKAFNETWRECRDKLAQAEPAVAGPTGGPLLARDALVELGWSVVDADRALADVDETLSIEEQVRTALKKAA